MATNLKIGFPDIPFNAATITPSVAYATANPVTNLVNGSRASIAELATSQTGTHTITFDLGSGVTQSCDYFALINAKILKSSGVTSVVLKGSDGVTPATIATITLSSATLVGGQGLDYITTFATTTAYRYWIVEFTSVATSKRPVSKIYLGTLLDLGRDPQLERSANSKKKDDKGIYEAIELSLNYKGISTTNRQTFETKIGAYSDVNDILLHANSYTNVQLGNSLLTAEILDYEFTSMGAKQNDLSISLRETF